jgi:hypothetical protein
VTSPIRKTPPDLDGGRHFNRAGARSCLHTAGRWIVRARHADTSEGSVIIRLMAEKLRIPAAMQERAGEVIAVTDEVSSNELDAEYARLARRLVARLTRKRPSPLTRGDLRIWAAGVLYVLAQVNFLFDRSQSPHMSAAELAAAVGVKQTTMANKAAMISRSLGIGIFEPDLTRAAMLEQHPLVWIVEVDGLLVDARTLPEAMQAEARRLGLIPDLAALHAAA